MGEDHVRIFDTTLRDGEQAPGFSLRPAEKLQLARQIDALGVDIIEAGFPISSPADAEAVRQIATEIRRPIIACLARCHRADLETRGVGDQAGGAGPHSHVHRHLGSAPPGQAAHDARAVHGRGRRVGPLRTSAHLRRAVLGGGRHAQRLRFPVPRRRSGDQGRRHDDQPAGYGRLLDAGRDAGFLPPHPRARVACRQRRVQRALPRRPRSRRRQLARGGAGRRASGRVHDQRHRRARRQRGARRDRDGDDDPPRSDAVHDQHRHAGRSIRPARC